MRRSGEDGLGHGRMSSSIHHYIWIKAKALSAAGSGGGGGLTRNTCSFIDFPGKVVM